MMQLLSLWKYFLWIQSIRPCFWAGEKKLMWFLFMKNRFIYLSIVNNYRPESLLPVASKIFEVICNNLLNDIEPESLLNINQSSFRANDSCTKRLISITHEIYRAFSSSPSLEDRGIFSDLSKAFYKVWYQRLLSNLNLSESVENCSIFLDNIFLIGFKGYYWIAKNLARVPQGSILGPLLFLVYTNDLPDGLSYFTQLFADDASLFSVVQDLNELAKFSNLWP